MFGEPLGLVACVWAYMYFHMERHPYLSLYIIILFHPMTWLFKIEVGFYVDFFIYFLNNF